MYHPARRGGRSGGHDVRARLAGSELECGVLGREDVERTAGGDVDDRREGPVAEQSPAQTAASDMAGVVRAAEDKAVALVKGGGRALGGRVVAILRRERRLQIGGVVDGMRPGVGSEELSSAW